MSHRWRWWAAALLVWAGAATQAAVLDWSADERNRILAHGPWPPPPARDPGNALSGQPAAIALGRALFFEARLSAGGVLACASCHLPQHGFADGRPRGLGRGTPGGRIDTPLDRHTPTLLNAGHQRWWNWGGAFDSLWSQALQPLLAPQEMGADPTRITVLLQSDAPLSCLWQRAMGAPPPADDAQAVLVPLAKALGAYVATLQSQRTAFDQFRDALARGDRAAAARYPLAAQRGLRLFIGRGNCSTCHAGPLFSNGEFADTGALFFSRPGVVDPGRHGGIATLLANPHNLLGPWADPPPAGADDPALKTRHVLAQHRNFGEFKVPGLRHVAQTAPYLHDGQKATLADVVDHYDRISPDRLHADGEQVLKPLQLQGTERADLLAFLHSLDGGPVPDPQLRKLRCR
ncbi:MAG: cytochrome c peroxidase [Aquabacterium sp.]|nr:cytochrome c peroxidase [Aquabacterium sp.]